MGVRITVLGCSGSVTVPDSPASGYLITAPDTPPLAVDFGGGVLGALQRHADTGTVSVLLSHLHVDHAADLPAGLAEADCYVCGPPPMVDAVMATLTRCGVPGTQIHVDKFTTAAGA